MFSSALRCVLATALLATFLLASADERRAVPKVGVVFGTNPTTAAPWDSVFRAGLRALGYVDGSTITILSRYAQGDATYYRTLVDELIALDVDVLFGAPQAMIVAKEATNTIPIVGPGFPTDPVAAGLINSFARPGGNLTGLYSLGTETDGKRLQLAMELLPGLKRLGLLFESNVTGFEADANALRALTRKSGVTLRNYGVRNLDEILRALSSMGKERVQALQVWYTPLTILHRDRIMMWSRAHSIPVLAEGDWAEAGAVLTYSADYFETWRMGALYVDKILKGAKPGDLPIEQPTKFTLVVNLKAAKSLGIKAPESLVNRADQVIR